MPQINAAPPVKLHASKHQDTGADEISVAALSGELADRQPSKAGTSVLGWTDEKLLKGAGAGVAPDEIDVPAASGLVIFGDGSDGDVTIAADTNLARDMFYNNLTVDATKTLYSKGYRIFVKGTLTNNGIISNDGGVGGNGSATDSGAGGAAAAVGSIGRVAAGGKGGRESAGANRKNGAGGGGNGGVMVIVAKTIVNNGAVIRCNGGAGGIGSLDDATAGAYEASVAGTSVTSGLGGGGGGGGNGASVPPAAGGTVTAPAAGVGGYRSSVFATILRDFVAAVLIAGGAGGGGGGTVIAVGGQGGGGGGGGGGLLVLIYNTLTPGTETAAGGAFGVGGAPDAIAGTAGTVVKIVGV